MNGGKGIRPLIFGEVLFDRFPDGTTVLGGAPFNVAWHLRGFGLDPLLISRIGRDPLGDEITRALDEWGLDAGGLQVDQSLPTGVVEIAMGSGQHSFDIKPDQSYDFIDADEAAEAAASSGADLVYHGTLALRNEASRAALETLLARLKAPVFLDVNLRDPWWRPESLDRLCSRARWLKVNEDELQRMTPAAASRSVEDLAARMRTRLGLDLLVVTRGAQGAAAWGADGSVHRVVPQRPVDLVDTVGAGDAFTAVVLLGLIGGWRIADTLSRAQSFANAICGVRGATVREIGFYSRHRAGWRSNTGPR